MWKLFKLIHSQKRLICFVDAVIGGTIGFYYHNPLVGAAVGGLLGMVNYELVSVRWLKLVPKQASQ